MRSDRDEPITNRMKTAQWIMRQEARFEHSFWA
jgi:hypothetical protein